MASDTEWLLFIDETGCFESAEETVAVVGWLVRQTDSPAFAAALRRGLDRIYPCHYPPHATDLNLPVTHLLLAMLPEAAHPEGAWAPVVASGAQALRTASTAAEVRAVLDGVARGRLPGRDHLRSADRWVRDHLPDLWGALEARRDDRSRCMVELLSEIGRRWDRDRTWLLASVDPGTSESASSKRLEDRYLDLLGVMFERLLALFRGQSRPTHVVRLFVAARDVHDATLARTVALRMDHLSDQVRRAERLPLLAPPEGSPDDRVRILQYRIQPYDQLVHPGIVLADFAANRLRASLGQAARWAELRRTAAGRVALSIEAPALAFPHAGPLPACALHGEARTKIAQAFETRTNVDLGRILPGWGHDQAAAWIQAAARGAS